MSFNNDRNNEVHEEPLNIFQSNVEISNQNSVMRSSQSPTQCFGALLSPTKDSACTIPSDSAAAGVGGDAGLNRVETPKLQEVGSGGICEPNSFEFGSMKGFEAKSVKAVKHVQQMNDSLFLNFDPLAEKSNTPLTLNNLNTVTPIKIDSCSSSSSNTTEQSSCGLVVGHLISPFVDEHGTSSSFVQPTAHPTASSIRVLDSTLDKDHAPTARSPWMHTSVLGKALGGGDQSPDWTSCTFDQSERHCSTTFEVDTNSLQSFGDCNGAKSNCRRGDGDDNDVDRLVGGWMSGVDMNGSIQSNIAETSSRPPVEAQQTPVSINQLRPSTPSGTFDLVAKVRNSAEDAEPHQNPYVDVGTGITGFLSKAARSVYARLSGGSAVLHDLIRPSTSTADSRLVESLSIPHSPSNVSTNEAAAELDVVSQSANDDTWQTVDSFRQSSVSCLNDISNHMADRDRVVKPNASGFQLAAAADDNDKENGQVEKVLTTNLANSSCNSNDDPINMTFELASPKSMPNRTADVNCELSAVDDVSKDATRLELDKYQLEQELAELRQTRDVMNNVLKEYANSLADMQLNVRDQLGSDMKRLMKVVEEYDDATVQTGRMFEACDDMRKRRERNYELIQSSQQRLEKMSSVHNSLQSKLDAMERKREKCCSNFESRLNSKLANQAKEVENYELQIDKLQLDSRQAQMRISSLKKQIDDQNVQNEELKNISNQLLQSRLIER